MSDTLLDHSEAGEIPVGSFALPLPERLLPDECEWLAALLRDEMILISNDSCFVNAQGVISFMHRPQPLEHTLDPDRRAFSERSLHTAIVAIVSRLLPDQTDALPVFESFIPPAQAAARQRTTTKKKRVRARLSGVFRRQEVSPVSEYDEATARERDRQQKAHDQGELRRLEVSLQPLGEVLHAALRDAAETSRTAEEEANAFRTVRRICIRVGQHVTARLNNFPSTIHAARDQVTIQAHVDPYTTIIAVVPVRDHIGYLHGYLEGLEIGVDDDGNTDIAAKSSPASIRIRAKDLQ